MQKQNRAAEEAHPRLLTIHTEFGLPVYIYIGISVSRAEPLPLKSKKLPSHQNHGVATLQICCFAVFARGTHDCQLNITSFQL